MKKLSLTLSALLLAGTVQAAPPAAQSKLDKIFNFEMLGVDIAYFQQFSGIPMKTNEYDNSLVYKVGQCLVTAYTSDKKITSLELEVSPKCTFDFGKMFDSAPGKVWAHQLTFGKAQDILGNQFGGPHFYSDCIYMCGNAADPSVDGTWELGGRDRSMSKGVRLETVLVSDKAIDAAHKWHEHMKAKEGEDYVLEVRFNSDRKYDDIAARLFRDVPVTTIEFYEGTYEKLDFSLN